MSTNTLSSAQNLSQISLVDYLPSSKMPELATLNSQGIARTKVAFGGVRLEVLSRENVANYDRDAAFHKHGSTLERSYEREKDFDWYLTPESRFGTKGYRLKAFPVGSTVHNDLKHHLFINEDAGIDTIKIGHMQTPLTGLKSDQTYKVNKPNYPAPSVDSLVKAYTAQAKTPMNSDTFSAVPQGLKFSAADEFTYAKSGANGMWVVIDKAAGEKSYPEAIKYLNQQAQAFQGARRTDESETRFKERKHTESFIYKTMADLHSKNGNHAEAVRVLQEKDLGVYTDKNQFQLAKNLEALGRKDEAETIYAAAAKLGGSNFSTFAYEMLNLCMPIGQYQQHDSSGLAFVRYSDFLARNGRYEDALKVVDQGFVANQDHSNHPSMGTVKILAKVNVLMKQGKKAEALAMLQDPGLLSETRDAGYRKHYDALVAELKNN